MWVTSPVWIQTRHTNPISRRRARNSGFDEPLSLVILVRPSKNTRTRLDMGARSPLMVTFKPKDYGGEYEIDGCPFHASATHELTKSPQSVLRGQLRLHQVHSWPPQSATRISTIFPRGFRARKSFANS
jgi:hypothetical protein